MDVLTVLLRTVMIYLTVFAVMRIMGKREIGKLSVLDLVISIMIAEIAVFVIEDVQRPMLDGLVPMFTLVIIQMTLAFISLKSRKVRTWIDGKPSLLIEKGHINRKEMEKQRYNLDDLLLQLRENKIANIADVEFAILEPSGKLTALTKAHLAPSGAAADIPKTGPAPNIRYEGLPLPLIMDGKVQDDNLQKLGKTRFWLKNQIQTKGAKDFRDVFFCSIDHRGHIFLDKKR
jgi:uncharacterized membrane protein YcaP (DUF421 family)